MDKKLDKVTKKILKENLDDVKNLQNLGDSLLKLSRVDGKTLQFEPIVVINSIKRAVKTMRPLAQKKKINLKISNQAGQIKVKVDHQAFLDVLTILLDNAIKYSPAETTISVKLEQQKNHLRLLVVDQGSGIPPAALPHIFDRFYQVDQARSKGRNNNGVGLGLAVAKKIIDQHGGRIEVRSSLKQGSTFAVILPIAV